MAAEHWFLKKLLPEHWFEAVKSGTKQWLMECPCGFKRDFWDAGGVRYKAFGEPRQYLSCPQCKQGKWHKIRKKTETEIVEFP